MSEKKNELEEIAKYFLGNEEFEDNIEEATINEIVEGIREIGSDERVVAFYDDHFSLVYNLPSELMESTISEAANDDNFEDEIDEIIDQANKVKYYLEKELTEDDIEDIKDDMIERGLDPDDFEP